MATTYTDRFDNTSPSGSVITTPLLGTSTSSQTVSTSSGLSFDVQANRAWRAGTRLRVSSTDATKIMEGEVQSYTGSTALVLEVDYTEGSGSTDSWTVNVAGARGTQGVQGIQGIQGSSGADGTNGTNGTGANPIVYSHSSNFTVTSTDMVSLHAISPTSASVIATLQASTAAGIIVKFANDTDGKDVTFSPASTAITINGSTSAYRVPGRSVVGLTALSTAAWIVTDVPPHKVGETIQWDSTALPDASYVWKNGSGLSRLTYAGLFAFCSSNFGTSSTDTFQVMDQRERVTAGSAVMGGSTSPNRLSGSGISSTALNAAGGTPTHTLTSAESGVPAHTHGIGALSVAASNPGSVSLQGTADAGNFTFTSNSNSGSSAASAHQNTQPTIISNFIMKA